MFKKHLKFTNINYKKIGLLVANHDLSCQQTRISFGMCRFFLALCQFGILMASPTLSRFNGVERKQFTESLVSSKRKIVAFSTLLNHFILVARAKASPFENDTNLQYSVSIWYQSSRKIVYFCSNNRNVDVVWIFSRVIRVHGDRYNKCRWQNWQCDAHIGHLPWWQWSV